MRACATFFVIAFLGVVLFVNKSLFTNILASEKTLILFGTYGGKLYLCRRDAEMLSMFIALWDNCV